MMGIGVQSIAGVEGTAVSKYGCEMKSCSNLKLCYSAFKEIAFLTSVLTKKNCSVISLK
jgi:hypothetical protein